MKVYLLGAGVNLAALALASTAALAQARPVANNDATGDIIVTGTRTQGVKAADSAAPIQVIGNDTLNRSGSVALLDSLAASTPSLNVLKGGNDSAALSFQGALRGLSPNDTLVLVNGRRRHTTANLGVLGGNPYSGAAAADLSLLPIGAIDHIEVLTDGAAAQYGSDAIAGVINIILKKSNTGGSATAGFGQYYKSDGDDSRWSINKGFALGDAGFLNATVEGHYHDHTVRGGIDRRYQTLGGAILPGISPVAAAGLPLANGYPLINQVNGDPQYDLYNVVLNGGYDLGDVQIYASGTYSNRNASRYGQYRAATVITGVPKGSTTPIYPIAGGFTPKEAFNEIDFEGTAGVRGNVAGWHWDLSSTYGKNHDKIYMNNSGNAALFALLQSQSTVPLSPQRNFYDGSFISTEWTNTLDLDRSIAVGLASPLNIAGGIEYRRDTYAIRSGEFSSYYLGGAQAFPGFTPGDAGQHSRSNISAYVDLAVDPVSHLHVDAAGRFEHYSDFGDAWIYKFTGRYDFSPAIAMRGTISTGFRAPTIAEEFYSGTNVGPTSINVQLPPNSSAAKLAGFGALKPELSRNYSAGFVLHPAHGLQITLDGYRIDLRRRILVSGLLYASMTGVGTTSQALLNAIAARNVAIDPNLTFVAASIFANAASTSTDGVELTANYMTGLGTYGRIDWSVGVNYNHTKIKSLAPLPTAATNTVISQTAFLTAQAISALTTATPSAKAIVQAVWSLGRFSANVRSTVYGAVSERLSLNLSGSGAGAYTARVPATPIFDVSFSYKLTRHLSLTAGADNVFNKKAPTIPTITDSTGAVRPADGNQIFNAPYKFTPWGFDGGFYYARATVTF